MLSMKQTNTWLPTGSTGRYTNMTTFHPLGGNYREEGYFTTTYISRKHFNELTKLGVSIDTLADVSSYSRLECLSQNTHLQMLVLNNHLSKYFMGYDIFDYKGNTEFSREMIEYAETSFTHSQVSGQGEGSDKTQAGTFYEIFPADGKRLLVVVENNFLNHLTLSKDNCKQFVLACLSLLDKFGTTSVFLNEFYLKLMLVNRYHEVLGLRV